MFKRSKKNLEDLDDSLLGVNIEKLREDGIKVEKTVRDFSVTKISQITVESFKPIEIFQK